MRRHSRESPYFHHARPPAERPRWLVVVWAESCACSRCARIGGGVRVRYVWHRQVRTEGQYRRAAVRAAQLLDAYYVRSSAAWRRGQVQFWMPDGTRWVWRERASRTPMQFDAGELFANHRESHNA